jgi:alpha-L-fucosidase 2
MPPENQYKLSDGPHTLTYSPTIDIEIIRSIYQACIAAGKELKEKKVFLDSLENTLQLLPPLKISPRYNIIQEWINDYEETEPGHRHMSQLFGLYPGDLITPADTALFAGAGRTIARRLANGGGHTGWSRAWIINFYARLLDGEKAGENVNALLQKSTLPNMFDNHPPFQIDGNFGGIAGIAEMLLQSHAGGVQLLPALPKAWKNGKVKGLCARGGFVVNMEWKEGKLVHCSILSRRGNVLALKYGDHEKKLNTKAGNRYEWGGE